MSRIALVATGPATAALAVLVAVVGAPMVRLAAAAIITAVITATVLGLLIHVRRNPLAVHHYSSREASQEVDT